ncbi:aminopeptidase N [Asticcacaulis biprosthecium C19]|uniref:Aminopeptidase N n=1 Tax=Asticcacaulis biprosthecium C19 TaxID=715226 RepID=F4QPM3_9CAUL|nr:aminopeptidase N [Asticcacaulis biprosthecium]EGF91281.1 aminopeptidase N [Asticcacaulis biprosthecium C19]
MRTEQPPVIRLADYKRPDFLIPTTELTFDLAPTATRVKARLTLQRQGAADAPLVLMGERLKLISVAIDGQAVTDYTVTDETLTIAAVPDRFVLDTEIEINPSDNKTLEGLYMSSGRYCSQCEAEGFRKITYYLDRPDSMSKYRVRIEAPKAGLPHLLSNGNLIETGELGNGRHFAQWEDPFNKPAYLFALVAGELDVLEDSFTTVSGREVALRIYVDTGMRDRAVYAMDALKRSMRWDEEAYGREYDLDLFMIVAVRDFNFGAMENKGLNIFNASLLLADSTTATDLDYERIESVVAHEYFHNWSGNRVTCRDWFQLCLKEGLTVYRDQGFSADQRGHAVQRIKDVRALRARQFPEDSGPLAHPARPSSYAKIDNFYTATIYEKGAEIVGVLRTIVGADTYRRALDHYFAANDGTAATLEDFVASFSAVTGEDYSGMLDWYTQAGTPQLHIAPSYDSVNQSLTLHLTQATRPTPGQPTKTTLPIPIRLGLLSEAGETLTFNDGQTETLIVLRDASQDMVLNGVAEQPVVSALRHFSAPVILNLDEPENHAFARLKGDPDPFNRWEAAQGLARTILLNPEPAQAQIDAFAAGLKAALIDAALEPAFKALILGLPTESDLAQSILPVDPAFLHASRKRFKAALSVQLKDTLLAQYKIIVTPDTFSPDAQAAGDRAFRNALLDLLLAGHSRADLADDAQMIALAENHFGTATNMTDMVGGLIALMHVQGAPYQAALDAFYARFRHEPLVMDKWFSLQATCPHPDTLARVEALQNHPDFDARTPNRWRALVGGFAANQSVFHNAEGKGYDVLVKQVLMVDTFNPMTAARMIEPLSRFRNYVSPYKDGMQKALETILAQPNLSKNVAELAGKALNG